MMTKKQATEYARMAIQSLINDNDEDTIAYEFYNYIVSALKGCKEPKTGHWLNKSWTMGCGVQVINVTCSCCGEPSGLNHMKAPYCPNCGAKMEVKNE